MNKPVYLGMSIDISKMLINFGMSRLNMEIEIEQNYLIWILIALLFIL